MEEKKNGPSKAASLQDDATLQELAKVVMDSLDEAYRVDWEPFEVYAQKLRSHIHSDPILFRQRFIDGYEHLLEVLHEKHDEKQSNE